jgi:hypothetical protein
MRWGVKQKVGSKEPHAGHGGPGKIGWKDERHRRSGVERGEQIVLAMLAGVVSALLAGGTTPSASSPSSARVTSTTDTSRCLRQPRYALWRKVWRRVRGYRSTWGGLRG